MKEQSYYTGMKYIPYLSKKVTSSVNVIFGFLKKNIFFIN